MNRTAVVKVVVVALVSLAFVGAAVAPRLSARLTGDGLDDLRARIRTEFVGATTCTHLNDMMRALADVGLLAARIGAVDADQS